MAKLANTPRATCAAVSPAVAVVVRAPAARPTHDLAPAARLTPKTVLFTVEVVEIVAFGLVLF